LREQFEQALSDPEWAAFQFTTAEGGNVSEEELASAARQLDERLYRQEFEASFEGSSQGLAYYAFSRAENVRACQFRPGETLIWSLDFNVNPMCSVLVQRAGEAVHVLDEMVLADANTPAACQELLRRTAEWRRRETVVVDVYGDASGHQRRTCGTETDWSLIREFFKSWTGQFLATVQTGTRNPGVRDRVALVNARLCSAAGERNLFVDPRCRELIKDLECVSWKANSTGQPTSELDKADRTRTHVSDALGYYVAEVFPMRTPGGHNGSGRLW
jgi:hypothetical protein